MEALIIDLNYGALNKTVYMRLLIVAKLFHQLLFMFALHGALDTRAIPVLVNALCQRRFEAI